MKATRNEQVFELMSQGLWQIDAAGKTSYANLRMAAMVGYSNEGFAALPPLSLVRKEDRAWLESRHQAARDDHQCQLAHKDGSWLSVVVEAIPLHDEGGRFEGTLALVTDVTERAQEKENLRALAARLSTVREDEKSRIARDLHDDLGQLVTALKLDLRWMERRLGELPASDAVNALLDRAVGMSALADQTIAAVQRVAAELRPLALSALGLGPALEQEASKFRERTGIDCTATVAVDLPALSESVATALYRIAQEALTNVARHSDARRAQVQLELAREQLILRVSDDGRGFPPRSGEGDRRGLLGMRERALGVGATLNVESGAGKGTQVTVRVPLSKVIAESAGAR